MYLNGDYSKLIEQDEGAANNSMEEGDISTDPEQLMRHSQDVDEWLLTGLSENCSQNNHKSNVNNQNSIKRK